MSEDYPVNATSDNATEPLTGQSAAETQELNYAAPAQPDGAAYANPAFAPAASNPASNPAADKTTAGTTIGDFNMMAIISFACGLLGLWTLIPAIAAVVCGHISLNQLKNQDDSGREFAIAGLVLGYAVIILAVLTILAALVFTIIVLNSPAVQAAGTAALTSLPAFLG